MSPSPILYPFGRSLEPTAPSGAGRRDCLVLGPIPSAMLVRWTPPDGHTVQALPVDNEPEAWWDGSDQALHITRWKEQVNWQPAWGSVGPSNHTGIAGRWLRERVMRPLRFTRDQVCMTTCLDTYHAPVSVRHRIHSCYEALAQRLHLPTSSLPDSPSEAALLHAVMQHQLPRLSNVLRTTSPTLVVTLGGTSAKVFAALIGTQATPIPERLGADPGTYGKEIAVRWEQLSFRWLPLAHPVAPNPIQLLHDQWIASQSPRRMSAIGADETQEQPLRSAQQSGAK